MSLVQDVWRTAKSIATGHAITLKEFFKPPITIRYPEEKPDYPLGVRGIPSLKVNDQDRLNCTGCGMCARACPTSIISVEMAEDEDGKKMKYPAYFNLDSSRCLVCNLCIEACPFDALEMSDWVYLAEYDPELMVLNMDDLAEIWKKSSAVRVAGGERL